jgi:hypothetical protein
MLRLGATKVLLEWVEHLIYLAGDACGTPHVSRSCVFWGVGCTPHTQERCFFPGFSSHAPLSEDRSPVTFEFMGVALVLRNVWVWLHAEVMAQPQRGARQLRPQSLRFARLLLWLMMEVAKHYRLLKEIPVYHDLYERAQAFGIVFNY